MKFLKCNTLIKLILIKNRLNKIIYEPHFKKPVDSDPPIQDGGYSEYSWTLGCFCGVQG
jgi:hypothetical protein